MSKCISCNRNLHGNYCHRCGEKVVEAQDFSFKKIMGEAIISIFNIDSSFYKSIKYLLVKPGFLTQEYIRGHRKPYMKPFQLNLVCIIIFYVFFSSVDIFLVPSKWYFNSDSNSPDDIELAQGIAGKWNLTIEELSILYDARVGTNSKLFVLILLPIIALGSMLIGYSSHKQYGIHLIHAIHLFTFMLVSFLILYLIAIILPGNNGGIYIVVPILSMLFIYFTLSIKRIFNYGLIRSFLSSFVMVTIVFVSSFAFRYSISYLTLKSLEYSFFMDGF